uniref:Reverse transcriptase N-terminal domain-containing protein n=1 Tax=Sebdenia flabellata TaxID=42024 RepID=A0A1C9C9U4_9FLOR|nr:hypothetical protein Sebd_057 [Sebdenia flabellata]AOM65144.1 hypothetical protein Sebd_057 [Sebdenia flabellata]
MKSYSLNDFVDWKFLPWKQINKRVFMLQKKIYEASKTCQKQKIYKLQNILINCNEAKIIAIENTSISILEYYLYYDSNKYILTDRYKFIIFQSLFKKCYISNIFTVLLEKVRQYLIYLCIQPEWEARFEPLFHSSITGEINYSSQEKLINFLKDNRSYKSVKNDFLYINHHIVNKYINTHYFINKIQSLPYINYCLELWLNNCSIEEVYSFESYVLKSNNLIFYKLIYKILCTGIEWFNLKNLELESKSNSYKFNSYLSFIYNIDNFSSICISNRHINTFDFLLKSLGLNSIIKIFCNYNTKFFTISNCKTLNSLNVKVCRVKLYNQIISNLCKDIMEKTKLILYKKDLFNRWRAKKSLKLSTITLKIFYKFIQFYKFFVLFLRINIIKYIQQQLKSIIVTWIKKKYKSKNIAKSFLNKNYLNNHLLVAKEKLISCIYRLKLDR